MLRLVAPAANYADTFVEAAAEFVREGRPDSTYAPALGYDPTDLRPGFARYVADLISLDTPTGGDRWRYRDRVLWLVDGEAYIGQVSVRPELATGFLLTYGGHIGYCIRPSQRRRGYGTRILTLALPVARDLGLCRVLLTCNADNEASRRIIERNGGLFERALLMPRHVLVLEGCDPDQPLSKLRFWIDLRAGEPAGPTASV